MTQIDTYGQRPQRFMHKPLMESDMVNYLKRYHDLMVKSIGVFYVFSYDNLHCFVVFLGCESRGSQKT